MSAQSPVTKQLVEPSTVSVAVAAPVAIWPVLVHAVFIRYATTASTAAIIITTRASLKTESVSPLLFLVSFVAAPGGD